MRQWFTIIPFLTLPHSSVMAQVPATSEQAPLNTTPVFTLPGSASVPSLDDSPYTSTMTGMYFQFSGLALNPADSGLTSRDPNVNASLGDMDMTYSSGWGVGFAVGYDFNTAAEVAGRDVPFALDPRVEFEVLFRLPSNSTGLLGDPDDPINDDPVFMTFGLNAFLDFDIKGPVDPYIGAGIGLTYVEFGDRGDYHEHNDQWGSYTHRHDDDVSDDFVGSFQIMAGVNVQLNRNWILFGGVRYFETDDANIDGFMFDFSSTDIEFGVRFMMR